MPKLEDIMFINTRLIALYLDIEKYSLHQASNKLGMTYAYANKVLKIWAKKGLVYMNKSGRRYDIVFTPRGKRLAIAFTEMRKILKEEGIQYNDG